MSNLVDFDDFLIDFITVLGFEIEEDLDACETLAGFSIAEEIYQKDQCRDEIRPEAVLEVMCAYRVPLEVQEAVLVVSGVEIRDDVYKEKEDNREIF